MNAFSWFGVIFLGTLAALGAVLLALVVIGALRGDSKKLDDWIAADRRAQDQWDAFRAAHTWKVKP